MGAFDGRYVYYVPFMGASAIRRYDTRGAFEDAAAWSTFDAASVGNTSLDGVAFDGRYMYFGDFGLHTILRFDAKDPPGLPPAFRGSFY
jgi:hypothetical protein